MQLIIPTKHPTHPTHPTHPANLANPANLSNPANPADANLVSPTVQALGVGDWAAQFLRDRIQTHLAHNPEGRPFVLGLPTGSTPLEMYRQLVAFHQAGELSFRSVVTVNLDEYVGLPLGHPQSFRTYMEENLFRWVDLPADQAFVPDGMAADLVAECDRYEARIADLGGIDLLVGGVGENGHIAFNEPGTAADSRTHVVALNEGTRRVNARFFEGDLSLVPTQALTMGLGTIFGAKEVMILATGAKKAEAIQRALGPVDLAWPISTLGAREGVWLVCDEAAAGLTA